MPKRTLFTALLIGTAIVCTTPVTAATIWTTWTSATVGTPGSAAGTLNGVSVTYSGEVNNNTVINGTSPVWSNPASSFIGGTVTTSPSSVGDVIALLGAAGTNTLTFSSPVVNPVFAIWSLGEPTVNTSMTFNATPTFEVGGPDIYGGGPIIVSGNVVSGSEGSGVVQFTGTFSSISWTDTAENYYGFTIGQASAIPSVPEPATLPLLAVGFIATIAIVRFRY